MVMPVCQGWFGLRWMFVDSTCHKAGAFRCQSRAQLRPAPGSSRLNTSETNSMLQVDAERARLPRSCALLRILALSGTDSDCSEYSPKAENFESHLNHPGIDEHGSVEGKGRRTQLHSVPPITEVSK